MRTELRVGLTAARRGTNWLFGRMVVDDRELAVRSAIMRWIPARSVAKDAVGEISVMRGIEIQLPVLHWRRVDVMEFEPGSPFADVTVKLAPRKRIVDVLRARGYSVIDEGN